jgi:hypothetical protein
VAPIVAWLCTDEAAGVSSQILHTASGSIGIMQQPAIIRSFKKSSGTWSLDELDRYVPELLKARELHDAAVKEAGVSELID